MIDIDIRSTAEDGTFSDSGIRRNVDEIVFDLPA